MKNPYLKKVFDRIGRAKNTKTILYCAVILIALVVFLLSSSIGKIKSPPQPQITEEKVVENASAHLEKRLESILSSMRGAGQVRVMLTLDRTAEQIIASSEKSSGGDKSFTSESKPATLQEGGREEAIVLSEVFPRIRGVIVLAEGAADIGVRQSLVSAVSTVLGIDERNVEVFVMGM